MIRAEISSIVSSDDVNIYEFNADGLRLSMLGLENSGGLKVGDRINLAFKSSDVIIALKKLENCSLTNEIRAKISNLIKGKITTIVQLKATNFEFESIISTNSCLRLNLKQNDEIYAYIKATSLYISDEN